MNIANLDLNLLRILDAILAERSTTKAGDRVGLSQPAVSAALGRLRYHLDDPLFVREGQKLVPTEYASQLEEPLRQLLDDLNGLLSNAQEFDVRHADISFKISGSDYFSEMLMPPLARHLAVHAPEIGIRLVDMVPDNHVVNLQNRTVDLAIMPHMEFPSWCHVQKVFQSRFLVVARQGHPKFEELGLHSGDTIPLESYCEIGHVAFSQLGNMDLIGNDALKQVGRERQVVMTLPIFGGVGSVVAESDYIALLPEYFARKVAPRLKLDLFEAPMEVGSAHLYMVWHRRNSNDPGHRWLRGTIQHILDELHQK